MCIFTANKMCATLEKIFNLVYYYRNYRSKMFAGIDFTSGDTEVLSKKTFKFNKTLLCVLILAAALLLAGCGGAKSTRAKADETVHTTLFDFTCGQPETIEKFGNIAIPEGDKLVQFHISVTNTSDETYDIFKDDFQLQWGDGDNDFGVAIYPVTPEMFPNDTKLEPGATVEGNMLVAVPSDTATLTVAYQEVLGNGNDGNNFFVDLSL